MALVTGTNGNRNRRPQSRAEGHRGEASFNSTLFMAPVTCLWGIVTPWASSHPASVRHFLAQHKCSLKITGLLLFAATCRHSCASAAQQGPC